MSKRKFNSRALRQLADDLIRTIAEEFELSETEPDELVTSLVRQWITYDGNATLLLGGAQVYFVLSKTPLGKPRVIPEPGLHGWLNQLTRDWQIRPEELPDIIEQLNRGQSAEVTNAAGLPLRLWVNPKKRGRGVEPLVQQHLPPGTKRNYRKLAFTELEQQFGPELDAEEMEALACSVANQWQKYEGHACLFTAEEQFIFTFAELSEGRCRVNTERWSKRVEPVLCSLGLPPDLVPDAIARINLDQQIEFRNRNGVRSRLWHDPKARCLHVEALDPVPPEPRSRLRPIFCPKCGAVLRPWREGEREQPCPLCGQAISAG